MISPEISAFLGRGFLSSLLAPLPEVLETPQEQAPFVAISDHFLQALPHLQVRGRVREAWTRPSMTSLFLSASRCRGLQCTLRMAKRKTSSTSSWPLAIVALVSFRSVPKAS